MTPHEQHLDLLSKALTISGLDVPTKVLDTILRANELVLRKKGLTDLSDITTLCDYIERDYPEPINKQ